MAAARSPTPSFGEGELLVGGAAVSPVALAQLPLREQAAFDQHRDSRERRARTARQRVERRDIAAGEGRPNELRAARIDVLDASEQEQAGGLGKAALARERIGFAEQLARLALLGPPARFGLLLGAPPRPWPSRAGEMPHRLIEEEQDDAGDRDPEEGLEERQGGGEIGR